MNKLKKELIKTEIANCDYIINNTSFYSENIEYIEKVKNIRQSLINKLKNKNKY